MSDTGLTARDRRKEYSSKKIIRKTNPDSLSNFKHYRSNLNNEIRKGKNNHMGTFSVKKLYVITERSTLAIMAPNKKSALAGTVTNDTTYTGMGLAIHLTNILQSSLHRLPTPDCAFM